MPPHLEAWINRIAGRLWPGTRVGRVESIRGDASGRRFWRANLDDSSGIAPRTAIVVDLGPDDLPLYARALGLLREPLTEPPFIDVQRFFKSIGIAVPELYEWSAKDRMLLVEDVGDQPLFEAALQSAASETAAALYRGAIDELLRIHCEGSRASSSECLAFSIAYDERLFRWELEHFVEFGLSKITDDDARPPMASELDRLAARLGAMPRVLSHRDYHGYNLFVQNGAVRVIDFQDALMAPAAQDLSVLLTTRDTSRVITPEIEERLLHYYLGGLARRSIELEADEFFASYRLCVLQHALKVIGRFSYLERHGRPEYTAYIPFAIVQARRALDHLNGYPEIRGALDRDSP
ncbi:MAG: phosphotransferase [Candidatus Binataceae bacterium]|nr:phosphotransferase [Candidatus Binataceae bacterium]